MQPDVMTAPPAVDATPRRLYVTVEDSPVTLEKHVGAWDSLVDHAAEPNPFFEPHALLAAWRHLAPPGLRVVLVWAPRVLPGQPPHLAGLFPVVPGKRYRGLRSLAIWHHLYSYLGTPLVRVELVRLALDAFLDWLRDTPALAFEWPALAAEGAVWHALIDAQAARGHDPFSATSHTRAMFRPAAAADAYFDRAMSGKKRKELRRQERRLGDGGKLVYDDGGELEPWLDEFVALEATGWKGRGGTALRDDPAAHALFRAFARGAAAHGRWMTLALRLDGRAIAMKCNLRAGPGAMAFKIAYDESFARFSPGVLLELEQIRRLHAPGAPAWMDSGAAADHPMIGHLWRDRIAIETLVVPTGRPPGAFAVAALPLVRWASRTLRRLRRT